MISVIIINYKQKEFTRKCVESVYGIIKSVPVEVIVINNSPEEDLSFSESDFPGLIIIENVNRGYSEANNKGADIAKGEYLFFLNADTEIKSDFASDLIMRFSGTNFGAIGLKLLNTDRTFQLSYWKENTFFNEIQNKKSESEFKKRNSEFVRNEENNMKELTEVDWVTGAALIVKKDKFFKAGKFDEEYFLFYEDADLCKRFTERGLPVYFYPFSEIIHHKGENVNPLFRSDSYYHSKKSQMLYYKKHNGLIDNFLLRAYLLIKFSLLYLFTFKEINLKIVKAAAGFA